jgi:ATP dependent DNA ligase domain
VNSHPPFFLPNVKPRKSGQNGVQECPQAYPPSAERTTHSLCQRQSPVPSADALPRCFVLAAREPVAIRTEARWLSGFSHQSGGQLQLRSRNNKGFSTRYPAIAGALRTLPEETILDGEIVALDEAGRPSFHALQNYGSSVPIYFYAFDLLMCAGRDIRSEPLDRRRKSLRSKILSKLSDPVRYSPSFRSNLSHLIQSVREHRLEGLIAKRRDSCYEAGQRSSAWLKMRVNPAAGLRNRRVHAQSEELRCVDLRLLRKRQAHIRRTDAEWVHACTPSYPVPALAGITDREVSIRQPAQNENRAMGPRINRDKDEGVPLVKAGAGRAIRVRGVGDRQSLGHSRCIALRDNKNPKEVKRK